MGTTFLVHFSTIDHSSVTSNTLRLRKLIEKRQANYGSPFAGRVPCYVLCDCLRILEGNKPDMKILVVDNDPTYLGLLSEVLRLHGYEVASALDGEEALSCLKDEPVDLVISDISMPKMNGMNLHRHIRQDSRLKRLPFAWNSGYRELRDAVEVEDPSIDLKFDKTMPVPNLLFFLDHLEARRKQQAGAQKVASC